MSTYWSNERLRNVRFKEEHTDREKDHPFEFKEEQFWCRKDKWKQKENNKHELNRRSKWKVKRIFKTQKGKWKHREQEKDLRMVFLSPNFRSLSFLLWGNSWNPSFFLSTSRQANFLVSLKIITPIILRYYPLFKIDLNQFIKKYLLQWDDRKYIVEVSTV